MRRSTLGAFLSAVEHTRQDLLETFWLQKALLDVFSHNAVQLFHRNGAAPATGLALPGRSAASVIPVSPTLPGPQRHCPAAGSAKADAGKERRSADDAWRGHCGAARFEQRLHRLKLGGLDDRRHGHFDHLSLRLPLARFQYLVSKRWRPM
jgi:hypothetical protein